MSVRPIIPLLFVFLAAVSMSCYIRNYTLSVLEPAEIQLPSSIQKVSIWNVPGAPSSQFDSLKLVSINSDTTVRQIKAGFLQGVYDVISNSPRFSKVVIADRNESLAGYTIHIDELKKICRHDTTETVLILTRAVGYEYLWAANITDETVSGYYFLVLKTSWLFFAPFEQKELKRLEFTDTVGISSGFMLNDYTGILYDACYAAGKRAGIRISPYWRDVNRIFYNGPGRDLKDAGAFVVTDRWYNAAGIWNDITEGKNKKLAARASYNMALAFEKEDDLDQAYLWISFSDSLIRTTYSKEYKTVLEKRILKKQKLDSQLAGN